jgi:hypothetical protein
VVLLFAMQAATAGWINSSKYNAEIFLQKNMPGKSSGMLLLQHDFTKV